MNKILKLIYIHIFCATLFSIQLRAQNPTGLNKGDKVTDFTMKDQNGKITKLSDKLKTGPLVLIFYRGQWCPYCNKYLSRLQDSLVFIAQKGASIVAVSPENFDQVEKTLKKTKATFPVIFDEDLKIMKLFKVNYALDELTLKKYKSNGKNFEKLNGTNGNSLTVPATYIIGTDKTIKYVFFNPDYTLRAPVKEILKNL